MMSKYTVAQIKNWDVDTETPSGGWIPARPLNPTGVITRCRHALGVLTKRYDVLDWEHEAFAVESKDLPIKEHFQIGVDNGAEEIMVNTPYDVFILPLRPSGLSSGPRFVVHVPGLEARGGGKATPPSAPVGATLSNPWTGKPRDYRDVDSDPEGVLCVEPGAPLKAAPSAPVGVEEMQRRLDREESDHGRTIDQRDAAEDALSRMFQAVTGRTAEWSSAWGYVDAIEEVEEHVATLAAERDRLAAENARLREAFFNRRD